MPPRLRAPFVIVALGLLFFSSLVAHPSWVLYSDGSDLLGLIAPAERFLARSWRQTGEIPLWCPDRFGGSPFLHDLQVAAFYPPHLILHFLPDGAIGPAMSWLAVTHVILAGLFMYAYARSRNLQQRPALVAALGLMFSGKWMLHLLGGGHYTTVGVAWLPLAVLLVESAIRKRSVLEALWGGTAFALLALSMHPQWSVYAGLFVALWTLATALECSGYWRGEATPRRLRSALRSWLACGACAATTAGLLTAVQWLPMLEALAQATRSTAGATGVTFSKIPMALLSLVGPPAFGLKRFDDWEYRGGIGVLWASAAWIAVRTARGQGRYQVGVWLGLIAFSLGGAWLVQGLPGFRLFAYPTRMLLIVAFPTAFLAGTATQTLFSGPPLPAAALASWRRLLARITIAALLSFAGIALLRGPKSVHGHFYWAALVILVPAALVVLGRAFALSPAIRRGASLAWTLLLLADAWALAAPHVQTRPESAVFLRPRCVDFLVEHAVDRGRVLDRHLPGELTRTPVSPALAMMLGIETIRGYNPLDIRRFREYLQFVADRDGPVPPVRQVVNFPIRNKALLDLFSVRYLVEPSGFRHEADQGRWRHVLDDPQPRTFNAFAGTTPLPPYSVYENPAALPRAFVVPAAAPLPPRSETLTALKTNDFRKRVFLEDYREQPGQTQTGSSFQPAHITRLSPNRIEVHVDLHSPGFLVLTDPWFPGWSCTVDGLPARLYRANYLFRGVELRAGHHDVVFRFAPASFRLGGILSGTALCGLSILSLGGFAGRGWRRSRKLSGGVPVGFYRRHEARGSAVSSGSGRRTGPDEVVA